MPAPEWSDVAEVRDSAHQLMSRDSAARGPRVTQARGSLGAGEMRAAWLGRGLPGFWDVTIPSAEVRPTNVSKLNTAAQMALIGSLLAWPVFDSPAGLAAEFGQLSASINDMADVLGDAAGAGSTFAGTGTAPLDGPLSEAAPIVASAEPLPADSAEATASPAYKTHSEMPPAMRALQYFTAATTVASGLDYAVGGRGAVTFRRVR
ncbi:hypothetical protein H696_00793 [Fonticula alba]|uniref:Uncharacterized protein n=1 Tax=Fonticula alba TaxID=691883 RepID=A0A058ZIA3_FONAL|nr:hypothetical protein H696_00793 [Fonticula alba]KCV73252.1 hypothetical protein H696_00793 [Fonticula alba]|eukprot:XP_009492953.1 hypothetical protein H696_00793 [Fonticula alba]